MIPIINEIETDILYEVRITGETENGIAIGVCFKIDKEYYKRNGWNYEQIETEKKQAYLNAQSDFTNRFITESLQLKRNDSIGFSIDELNEIINNFKKNLNNV